MATSHTLRAAATAWPHGHRCIRSWSAKHILRDLSARRVPNHLDSEEAQTRVSRQIAQRVGIEPVSVGRKNSVALPGSVDRQRAGLAQTFSHPGQRRFARSESCGPSCLFPGGSPARPVLGPGPARSSIGSVRLNGRGIDSTRYLRLSGTKTSGTKIHTRCSRKTSRGVSGNRSGQSIADSVSMSARGCCRWIRCWR